MIIFAAGFDWLPNGMITRSTGPGRGSWSEVRHDPPFATGKLNQVLFPGQDGVIVISHLAFVREEPFEFEATPRTPVPLALPDKDVRAALRAGESDRRKALLVGSCVHSPSFLPPFSIFLPRLGGGPECPHNEPCSQSTFFALIAGASGPGMGEQHGP